MEGGLKELCSGMTHRMKIQKDGLMVGGVAVANFPEGLLNDFRGAAQCPVDRSWCAQRCCDEAAMESLLRRSRCCDGAAQTSSVALILRVVSRRDALNEEPASFPRGLIQISMVVAHSPRPPPWPRNI